jgi:hypothetical protein
MTNELLISAREQAEKSSPAVRAAALLRIARVQTAFDADQARSAFKVALEAIQRLPGEDGKLLLEHAELLAAAIAPDLLLEIPRSPQFHREAWTQKIGLIMLEHQHLDATFEYIIRYDDPSSFPFSIAGHLMRRLPADERQLALFRRATEVWREENSARQVGQRARRAGWPEGFIWLFRFQWKALPRQEALLVLREIVRVILDRPDTPIDATYDAEGSIRITSDREHTLFHLLPILRQLDEPLTESLVASHDQLAAALCRFPNGMESVNEEAEARRKEASEGKEDDDLGFVMDENSEEFRYFRALARASKSGDFGPPLERPLAEYRRDRDPEAPPGRKLFGSHIRCPKCKWEPGEESLWSCICGHIWNTFHTAAACPGCGYQWTDTRCHRCKELIPHSEWYAHE